MNAEKRLKEEIVDVSRNTSESIQEVTNRLSVGFIFPGRSYRNILDDMRIVYKHGWPRPQGGVGDNLSHS